MGIGKLLSGFGVAGRAMSAGLWPTRGSFMTVTSRV
jgi:hypothetical protein